MSKYLSPNFNDRKAKIKYLILHYTGMETGQAALKRMCDADAEVSAHYMIDEKGKLYNLVAESKRAWHAGVSSFEGQADVNSLSIGVELVNQGHAYQGYEGGYQDFPEAQMKCLITLCKEIIQRHDIKPWHVIAHSDVAPLRKCDPGEKFDWKRLSKAGIGVWAESFLHSPSVQSKNNISVKEKLKQWGYGYLSNTQEIKSTIIAFQRHFRPQNFDGIMDQETMMILDDLLLQKFR